MAAGASFKSTWTKEEDGRLIAAVEKWGQYDWYQIAADMPGRLPRQCRERYKNHARSGINTSPFTKEEDKIIVTAQSWCAAPRVCCALVGVLRAGRAVRILRHPAQRVAHCLCAAAAAGGTSGWRFQSCCPGERTTPSRTAGTPT